MLDEYCARYMVRGCHRHVSLLNDLLNKADEGFLIDPTLMHYSFAFCASHVHGNRYQFYSAYRSYIWQEMNSVCLPYTNVFYNFLQDYI